MPVRQPKKDVGWIKVAPQKWCRTCKHMVYEAKENDAWSIGRPTCSKFGFRTGPSAICNFYERG